MIDTYTVTSQRADGWWLLTITGPGLKRPGATQVRRLDQAAGMALDWLVTRFDRPAEAFAVNIVPQLDEELRAEIEDARLKRTEVDRARDAAGEASRKAARHLASQGISTRDIASLLGVSYQRVSQLLAS